VSDPRPDAPLAPPRVYTEAIERRGRWPGLVWAVPLAALLVVAYLGLQALANRGYTVVVSFKTSGGAQAGDTPVVYKGVTVGRVVRIQIAPDASGVDMTLRLDPRAKGRLGANAKFWLIGAEPNLTDFASLKAAVSGVTIGVAPGVGEPTRHFVGLDQPPVVPPDTPGTPYALEGVEVGSTRSGAGIYYHGLEVGRVERVEITGVQTTRLLVFINAPYDRLVRPGSLFFSANAADLSITAGQVNASLGPGSSVITGGFEFDTPDAATSKPQSPAGSVFHFYPNEAEAADQPEGPQIQYRAVFDAAALRPQVNAPVWLSGVRIGRVLASHVVLPSGAEVPRTSLTLEIEPEKLELPVDGDAQARTDDALRRLIHGGYRLTVSQTPPLIGTASLTFVRSPGAQSGGAQSGGALSGAAPHLIPTSSGAGLEDLTTKVNAILDKVNGVPIQAIGQDVREITRHLRDLVSSPQLSDSLTHLDGTLTQADQMMTEAKPKVGPLIDKLNQAADEVSGAAAAGQALLSGEGAGQDSSLPDAIRQLNDAARSIRSLADYLGRHPEALVRGKTKDAP
jgi:paraquat-inducible protein B